ncbi:hypothetical protein BLNAU_9911 [Blattamonas nauphoetae]|uniref:Uncharacterized protein n=1 Tax=Blattamonas nauphoetae TaxID=2049346 RepID=A0ABQ9XUN5_9EUKA|nr:hypothetical protein BLNAU_9911 [Blattamonas nauphoetae]
MKMLQRFTLTCSAKLRLALVKADLIPHLINTLNPQSLCFGEAEDIHIYLMRSINCFIWLATPFYLEELGMKDGKRQQAVHETILKQVLVPLVEYIWHLCVNHHSIMDRDLSHEFVLFLAQLLRISPHYRPTMDFVLHMPIFLAIPSCLTFFESDHSIWVFLYWMVDNQQDWIEQSEEVRQIGKKVLRMLRMGGIENVIEGTLRNDKNEYFGARAVSQSIKWNNLQGMNLPEPE